MNIKNHTEYRPLTEWIRTATGFLRMVALVEIFFFLFVFYSPSAMAVADTIEESQAAPIIEGKTDEEKLSKTLQAIKENISTTKATVDARMVEEGGLIADVLNFFGLSELQTESTDQLVGLNEQLATFNDTALANFAQIEAQLMAKGLPDIILQRHRAMVNQYQADYQQLQSLIQQSVNAGSLQDQQAAVEALHDFLQQRQFKRSHQPFDPNKLPFGTPDAEKTRKPIVDSDDLSQLIHGDNDKTYFASNLLNGILDAVVSPAYAAEPTAADLAETIDVQITTEIMDLASQLENDPIKIYTWVRNNIRFATSFGAMQGAHMTLVNRQGNAIDTASLLIALLRASGVAARYVYGTVEMPVDKVMNWVGGVETAGAAQQLLGQGGIPNVGSVQGGQVTHIRLEHAWVEAWVDFEPSRGVNNISGDSWIPMDASFKQYEFTTGSNLLSNVPFDYEGLVNLITIDATIDDVQSSIKDINEGAAITYLSQYQEQTQVYLDANDPVQTSESILGGKDFIVLPERPLSAGLPYKVVNQLDTVSVLPDNLRMYATVKGFDSLLGGFFSGSSTYYSDTPSFSYRISLPELNFRRLGVTYEPATDVDRNQLEQLRNSGASSIPLYLFNVKPAITLDGEVMVLGASTNMGGGQQIKVDISLGNRVSRSESFDVVVGDEIVVGINANGINKEIPTTRLGSVPSDTAAENLHQIALNYWLEADYLNRVTAQGFGVVTQRQMSVGLFSSPLSVDYFFGLARSGYYQTRSIDIAASFTAIVGQNTEKVKEYRQQTGIMESYLEGSIFDQLFTRAPGNGISAAQLLVDSNRAGIPIYHITSANIADVLPLLSIDSDIRSDIISGVNSGREVIIPERSVSRGSWQGTGYIIQDTRTGAAAYLISGGLGGGGDNPCPEEPSVVPLVVAIALIFIAALALAYVAPLILGGAAGAGVAAGAAIRALIASFAAILATAPAYASGLPFPDPCTCADHVANCLVSNLTGTVNGNHVCHACLRMCEGSGNHEWPATVPSSINVGGMSVNLSCDYWSAGI